MEQKEEGCLLCVLSAALREGGLPFPRKNAAFFSGEVQKVSTYEMRQICDLFKGTKYKMLTFNDSARKVLSHSSVFRETQKGVE